MRHHYNMNLCSVFVLFLPKFMRIVKQIPHDQFKITIFSWNDKYLLKLEIGQFEQVYKVRHTDVDGLDDLVECIDTCFLQEAMEQFKGMRSSFSDAFKRVNQTK